MHFWTLDKLISHQICLIQWLQCTCHVHWFWWAILICGKKMRHSENNSYHLTNKKALKLTLYKKRFSCICSYFWEYSQTNDKRTKFLMKTARRPPNRRIKVCEISKNSLQIQKHLESPKIKTFTEEILIKKTFKLTLLQILFKN